LHFLGYGELILHCIAGRIQSYSNNCTSSFSMNNFINVIFYAAIH
jgi:hypothetical protein